MAQTKDLLDLLKAGIVDVQFKHWKTDAPLTVRCSNNEMNQSPNTDTIVVYDVDNEVWTDIRVNTITGFNSIN